MLGVRRGGDFLGRFCFFRLRLGSWSGFLGDDHLLGRRSLLRDRFGRRFLHRGLFLGRSFLRRLGGSDLGLADLGFIALTRSLSFWCLLGSGRITRGFRHLPSPFWPWR